MTTDSREHQRTFDKLNTTDRGRLLRELRGLHPYARLLLFAIDSRTRSDQNASWTCKADDWATDCEISRSAAFRWLRWLDEEANLIRIERPAKGSPTFRIAWSRVIDWENVARPARPRTVPIEDSVPNGDCPVLNEDCSVSDGDSPVLIEDCHKEERNSSKGTFKPPPPTKSEPDPVVVAVVEAGVAKAAEAVRAARSHGMTDAAILQHVMHYANHPGRWGAGALVKRLESPTTRYLAPDQGWPPQSQGGRQEPATQQARTVDQLTDSEVRSLLSPDDQHALHEFCRQNPRGDPRAVPHFRKALEQAMYERTGEQLTGVQGVFF